MRISPGPNSKSPTAMPGAPIIITQSATAIQQRDNRRQRPDRVRGIIRTMGKTYQYGLGSRLMNFRARR